MKQHCRQSQRSMKIPVVGRTLVAAMLSLSGLLLAPAALMAQEAETEVSITVLPPAGSSQPAPDGDGVTSPNAPGPQGAQSPQDLPHLATDRSRIIAIQHTGVVTVAARELTNSPATVEQAWLLLSVWDDRGTAAGWNVSLATAPSGVFGLLAGRADTIALVFPQPVVPRIGREVFTGRYRGLIDADSVPLLEAPAGSGDGVWTQPLDLDIPDPVDFFSPEAVVLVLNLNFAP